MLPIKMWVLELRAAIISLGWLSVILFIALYAVATILMAPGAPMSITGGLVFGLWGIPIVATGATIGCAAAFGIARLRRPPDKQPSRNPKIQAIDDAICVNDWKVVMLMRLSPLVPFNLQNYVFGFTNIRFSRYLLASFLGMLPGTAVYVYIGSLSANMSATTAKDQQFEQWLEWGLLAFGLMLTLFATLWIGRKANEQLRSYGIDTNAT